MTTPVELCEAEQMTRIAKFCLQNKYTMVHLVTLCFFVLYTSGLYQTQASNVTHSNSSTWSTYLTKFLSVKLCNFKTAMDNAKSVYSLQLKQALLLQAHAFMHIGRFVPRCKEQFLLGSYYFVGNLTVKRASGTVTALCLNCQNPYMFYVNPSLVLYATLVGSYSWFFVVAECFRTNFTFTQFILPISQKNAWQDHLKNLTITSLQKQFCFLGEHSAFSFFPPFAACQMKLSIGLCSEFSVNVHFSVVDKNSIENIRTGEFSQFVVHRLSFLIQKQSICDVLWVQTKKFQKLTVQKSQNTHRITVSDGPEAGLKKVPLVHNKFTLNTFQCVITTFVTFTNSLFGLTLNYSSQSLVIEKVITLLENTSKALVMREPLHSCVAVCPRIGSQCVNN